VRRALAASPNPTIVHLDKVQRVKSASTWTFSWTAGVTRFARKDTLVKPREPLLVDPTTGSAVALTDARGGAMLLDSRLIDLQLTDAERQAVFDAVQREQPRAAPVPAAPAGAAAIRR
jgi:hypothetical protein